MCFINVQCYEDWYIMGAFHGHGGTPIAGWFIMGNPNLKFMIFGGAPISGKCPCRTEGETTPKQMPDFVPKLW